MRFGRFDGESYCVVHCRPNSDVVQMTSNIADRELAIRIANEIRKQGGHVFRVAPAGVVVAALFLIKKDFEAEQQLAAKGGE